MSNLIAFPASAHHASRPDVLRDPAVLAQDIEAAVARDDASAVTSGLEAIAAVAAAHELTGLSAGVLVDEHAPVIVRVRAGFHVLRQVIAGSQAPSHTLAVAA